MSDFLLALLHLAVTAARLGGQVVCERSSLSISSSSTN